MNWRFLAHGRLIILIGLYLVLSTGYNILFPLGRGNDEFAHFRYVQFIAHHHHLPVNQNERGEASYKSVHPPLYHALAASLFSWVDTQGAALRPIKYGQIPSQSLIYEVMDIDWILPTDSLIYPYRGAVLLWHLSRFLSSLLTAATIAMTYFTVLELLPGKKTSALMAAATIAFIPRFIISGSSVSDDSLVTLLMAVYLFLMVWLVKGQERWWHFMLIGITLGLALTTKFSIGLVPLTMTLFLCFLAWQRHWPVLTLVKRWALVAVTTSLVASWWFIFVIWNFNEIETQGLAVGLLNAVLPKIANATSGADVLAAVQGTKELVAREPFGAWLLYLSKSFWTLSLPKWSDESAWTDSRPWTEAFPLAPQVFWVSTPALILIIVGLGLAWRRADPFQRTWLGLFGLHILSFLPLMLLRYYMTGRILETAQGHHIILPAALAVAGFMMVGWSYWARPRSLRWLRPILPTLLLFWSIAQLYAIVHIFPEPLPLAFNSRLPPIDTQINLALLDSIELMGYSTYVQPDGSALETTLVWRAHSPTSKDYLTEVRLVNRTGQTVSSWMRHAADGLYPTRAWASGDILYDQAELPLYNLEPGRYTLTTYLLEAYQRPAREAAGPLFSVPITLTSPSNYRPAYKQLPVETKDGLIQVSYQLWPFDFFNFSRPVYGYRAAIPIVWEVNLPPASAQTIQFKLLGPDGQAFEPVGAAGNLQTFIVDPDWPAGMYRLKAEVAQNGELIGENFSAPWLEVKNRARQFTLPTLAHPVEANFYNHIKLLGYELPSPHLRPGQELSIFLHWQLLQTVNSNLQMFNHLYDANNQLKATFDRTLPPPFGGPIRWTPGQVVADGYTMPIEGLPDGIYTLRVGLYLGLGPDSWVTLPLVNNGQVSELNYISLSPIKIGSAPKSVLALDRSPQHPRHDRLGGLIELSGYDLNYAPTTQDIHLTLYWKCLAALDKDYTTFVHLQDEHGQIITQKDGPPAGGAYPTSLWEVNEVINDEIVLPVSAQVLTGNYELLVGMYELATGERLAQPGTGDNAIRLTLTDEFKQ